MVSMTYTAGLHIHSEKNWLKIIGPAGPAIPLAPSVYWFICIDFRNQLFCMGPSSLSVENST